MDGNSAADLVAAETPEGLGERGERIDAARELDLVVSAFGDKRPWTLDGFVEGIPWPAEHASLFEAASFLRDDDEIGFDTPMINLEHAGHLGDATDRLDSIRGAWEAEGRTVFQMEESPDGGRVAYIWSYGHGLKTEVSAHASDDETLFRVEITVTAPPPGVGRM